MKILHTATITIAIVLMIIVSPMAFGTLSFAARTNSTGTSAQHNNNITASSSKIPNINTPKIATTNPASHNATTTTTTKTVPSQITTSRQREEVANNATTLTSGSVHKCSTTDDFLWRHVYDPGRLTTSPSPLGSCVTVTGTVYSITHLPPSKDGTHDDDDGDLHFTLTLDKGYEMYSNGKPASGHIIVEVICHNPGIPSNNGYFQRWGDYCKTPTGYVRSELSPGYYPHGKFPYQGERLSVSGKLVNDGNKWNEIHPASNIHSVK
jgi:hypothetical protein